MLFDETATALSDFGITLAEEFKEFDIRLLGGLSATYGNKSIRINRVSNTDGLIILRQRIET